jgi:hypothetical protein
MKADESADWAVRFVAWQCTGQRNGNAPDCAIGAFIGFHGQNLFKITRGKKGLWASHTDWIGPNLFDEVNKATRWAQFS